MFKDFEIISIKCHKLPLMMPFFPLFFFADHLFAYSTLQSIFSAVLVSKH